MTANQRTTQTRTARLAQLATHLQQAREEERAWLARELHDELGALLTSAKLDVASLKTQLNGQSPEIDQRLTHLNQTLNSGIALKRSIVEGLCPSALAHLGLVESLEILAREFEAAASIPVLTQLDKVSLDETTALAAYRMVQESLTNVGRHATASQAEVILIDCERRVVPAVRDDGAGFDMAGAAVASHGLAGMRHRIEACGGQFTMNSAPGKGTQIVAVLPKAPDPHTHLATPRAAAAGLGLHQP